MVLQLTQSAGKAIIHDFITASVPPFPCPKSPWVLECDYIHLVLDLLCIRTYHLIIFFITELPFRCSKPRCVLEWDYTHLILDLISITTYRLMACFILSSRLSLCTATSMRATAPPLRALAVISMRSSHRCPCFCISAGQILIRHAFISYQHHDPHSPNK